MVHRIPTPIQPNVAGRCAHQNAKHAADQLSAVRRLTPDGQVPLGQRILEGHMARLARSKTHREHAAQELGRLASRHWEVEVQLRQLAARTATSVGESKADRDVTPTRGGRHAEVVVPEGGAREPVAEREGGEDAMRVVEAVADQQLLGVTGTAILRGQLGSGHVV